MGTANLIQNYVKKILSARVYDVAIESRLDLLPRLSKRLQNSILLKREDLQPVFSFKARGAYNKISHLSAAALERGVICASAGNHAQGVALAARTLKTHATIVMPQTTPAIKVQAVKNLGGKIILHGDTVNEALLYAKKLAKEQKLTFIHPFDDVDVIAGQGTVAVEILRQHEKPIEAIFVPIGGGGLLAGIAAWVKFLRPEIKVIGVEPFDAASMYQALKQDKRVTLDQIGIFADGVAVNQAGKESFKIIKQTVDDIILVNTDEICAAIKDIFDDTRSIAEPAGALALAGLKKYVAEKEIQSTNLIAINSGANINFDRLRHVAERAEIGEQREMLLAVTIPEKPGSFRTFCETIGKRSVTEFNYRYAEQQQAHIFVGIEVGQAQQEKQKLIDKLESRGYPVLDLSEDEMAKLHIRYMVGGRAPGIVDEVLYRFEFPERPGALLQFLNGIKPWNISLFHYRNHGAAYGRVLVGVQVPESERKTLEQYFNDLGYLYWQEADNPAYQLFLGN